MSLQFILGSSGSGKSHQLYDGIIQQSIQHPESNYIVIVPEQFTMQTQKDLVTMHPRHGIMNIDILSFLRLAYRIFDEVGHKEQVVLEDTGKSMLLRKVVANHSKDLVLFQNNVRRQGFISELKSLMSEILQYSIDEEQLLKMEQIASNRPMLKAKLQDIRTIYRGFRELMQNRYITAEEILDVLTDVIEHSETIRNSVICFDGFTGFTPSQYKLLSRLLVLAKEVRVTVTMDPREDVNQAEDEFKLFSMSKKTIQKLSQLANDANVKILPMLYAEHMSGRDVPYRFRDSKALAALEHNLFRYPMQTFDEEQEDIRIHCTLNAAGEVNFVIREIRRLVREEGYRYKDIAVVTGDIASYGRMFRREMEQANIPCFIDHKKDILSNIYVEFLRSAIEIVVRDYSYESVLRYLRCGMVDISKEDVDELENYIIALGIRGHSMWYKEWERTHRSKKPIDLQKLNALREQVVGQMKDLFDALSKKDATVYDYTKALYEFSVREGVYEQLMDYASYFKERELPLLAKEYEQIYRIVMELFDQFVELLGDEVMALSEYDKILESGLTEAKVGLIPPGMDQIVVGDTTRTRLKDIRALFLVGVNDGIIPAANTGGGILSDLDRELFAEHSMELAPTKRQNAYMEQFYLYLNLTKPQNQLYLTYNKVSEDGKANRPSYLIGKVQKMFPRIEIRDEEQCNTLEQILSDRAGVNYMIEGLRSYVEQEPDDVFKELFAYYLRSEQLRECLHVLIEGAFYQNKEKGLGKYVAQQLYGMELLGSVTRLEKFASCAFAHFMAYGLGLREREEYKIQVPDLGNLFHMALDLFSKKLSESDYDWDTLPEDIREEWASYCVHIAVEQYGNTVLRSTKRNEYVIQRLERIHKRTVWALSEQMKVSDFEPFGYELPFTYVLEKETEDQVPVRLTGRIDRLDVCKDEDSVYLKVMDYKSGKTSFDITSLYYGLQMQLAVYLSMAIQFTQETYQGHDIVPAGILYYHMDDPIIDRSADITTELLKKLKMNGLVNGEMEIIKRLDRNFVGENGNTKGSVKSVFIPVNTNKDGEPTKTSSIASRDEFEAITKYVKKKMDELSQTIMQGEVSVNPYKLGERTACDYCEYSGICGFDTKLPGYKYRRLQSLERCEAMEQMKEEVEHDEGSQTEQ